jgi:hypothetical protein
MFVWWSWAAAKASVWNRRSCKGSIAAAKGRTFNATRRWSEICWAL